MQFVSLEPTPRPPNSAFGLVTGVSGDTANWLQVPPTHMPWGNPAAHQPSIVRFTAEPLDKAGPSGSGSPMFGQCKRKSDSDMPLSRSAGGVHGVPVPGPRGVRGARRGMLVLDALRPTTKQHITEEKMAAHMRQLHISNSYTSHEEAAMSPADSSEPDPPAPMAPCVDAEQRAYKRLVLCEEIRQLQNEPMLPTALLARMQRPSMALVLWQPPAGQIAGGLSQAAAAAAANVEEDVDTSQQIPQGLGRFPTVSLDNNNTSGTIDLNTVHRLGQNIFPQATDSQAMDL